MLINVGAAVATAWCSLNASMAARLWKAYRHRRTNLTVPLVLSGFAASGLIELVSSRVCGTRLVLTPRTWGL